MWFLIWVTPLSPCRGFPFQLCALEAPEEAAAALAVRAGEEMQPSLHSQSIAGALLPSAEETERPRFLPSSLPGGKCPCLELAEGQTNHSCPSDYSKAEADFLSLWFRMSPHRQSAWQHRRVWCVYPQLPGTYRSVFLSPPPVLWMRSGAEMLKLSLTVLTAAIKEFHSGERSLSLSISPPCREAPQHWPKCHSKHQERLHLGLGKHLSAQRSPTCSSCPKCSHPGPSTWGRWWPPYLLPTIFITFCRGKWCHCSVQDAARFSCCKCLTRLNWVVTCWVWTAKACICSWKLK